MAENIKVNIQELEWKAKTGFIWLRKGTSGEEL
jgi:hypothetical protein